MINKLEYTRLNALLNQQIEYLTKKVEEKEKEVEENHFTQITIVTAGIRERSTKLKSFCLHLF